MPRKYAAYGKLLKYYRELGNLKIHPPWTQARIAKALGVSQRTYAGWENGESQPSSDDLRNFVSVLELSEEEEKTLYRSIAQVPPEIDNLPFQRNPLFTGREEHLDRLRTELQEAGTAAITQSISGLGGIGKTQLALEYAHCHYPKVYRVALWVNADKETLQASYASLAETLGLEKQHEPELDRRVQSVKQWLATHTNWLLIMDNADDLPLALSFMPAKPLGHVILTTRSQIVRDSNIAAQIKVEEMEPEKEGLPFLLLRSGALEGDTEDIRETALKVVELLGGLPLALDQAGAYIEERRLSFTDYIKRYHAERHRLLNRRGSRVSEYSEHPEPVAVTLELSFKEACKGHPLATDILHFCSFLQPDDIPEELFQHDNNFKFDTTEFDDAIAALQRYSLIKLNTHEKTFSMHRLVQAVLINAMSPDLQMQWRERVVRALNAVFPEEDHRESVRCERLMSHALVCAMWTEDELNPTVGVGELFHIAGLYLFAQGQYSEAETLLARVLPIYKQYLGVEHIDTASALNDLAVVYQAQNKYEQAELLYRQALKIMVTQLGVEHPSTASALSDLAYFYFAQGKDEQAVLLLQHVLAIQERQLGVEHPDTGRSLTLLGSIYLAQGKDEQAMLLYRRALKIVVTHLGVEHQYRAILFAGIARLMNKQGEYEKADAMFLHGLNVLVQQLGATHPNVQMEKRDYADFLHSIGRNAEATALETDDEP